MDSPKAAFEAAKALFGSGVGGLQNLRWEDVSKPARRYIEENPRLTAAQVILVLLTTCPGLVVLPALGWLGFGAIGPVAGSAAAGFQSVHGVGWIFSGLQSAAMGGYATTAVNGVVQGVCGLGAGAAEYFKNR